MLSLELTNSYTNELFTILNIMENYKILIVEDDKDWQEAISESLKREGFQVTLADTFNKAEYALRHNTYDGAVIDKGGKASAFESPTGYNYHDGLRVIASIQENQPWCRTVLMTGESYSKSAEISGAHGFADKGWVDFRKVTDFLGRGPFVESHEPEGIALLNEDRPSRNPESYF